MTMRQQAADRQDGSAVIWFLIAVAFVGVIVFFWVGGSSRALAALADSADVAQVAARAGTQHVDPDTGRLDPTRAATAAHAELAAAGMTGSVAVAAHTVTVTATHTVDLPLLAVLGKPTHTATSTRTATVISEP